MKLEPVIGLEIHVQLKTKSKMFCSCDNTGENQSPNTTICPVCMGHPGTLPVLNAEAVKAGVRAALALNLKVNLHSKLDRKNYFYPDLPKGYQISQYDEPLAQEGFIEVEINNKVEKVGIERLHLEEDTGKLLHAKKETMVDFNRAGTPLMEIVTKPEISSPEQAKLFLQQLRTTLRSLGVSDADMEKGHLRVDVNVSLRPVGDKKLYAKTELKNLNSFRAVERGLQFEITRLTDLWESGQAPTKTTTRGWDENKGISEEQRVKEAVHDYRYFPEPDLLPLDFVKKDIDLIKKDLPELPKNRTDRFKKEYKLSAIDAKILAEDNRLASLMEEVTNLIVASGDEITKELAAKLTVNWLVHKLFALLNEKGQSVSDLRFTPQQFADFLLIVAARRVNSTNAQAILRLMVETGKDAEEILIQEDLGQSLVESIDGVVTTVISKYPDQVAQFKAGKDPVIKFLVGAVMKESKGKANPEEAEKVLRNKLQ